MNLPAGTPGDPEDLATSRDAELDDREDDVQGHRMLSPDQAQERADAARIHREQKVDEERGRASDVS